MRIRVLKSIAGTNFVYRRGHVVDWKNEDEAERLIEAGAARKLTPAEDAYEKELASERAAKIAEKKKADEESAKAVAAEKKKRADAAKKADDETAETRRGRPPATKTPAKKTPAKKAPAK